MTCCSEGMQFNNLITPEKVKPFLPICLIEEYTQQPYAYHTIPCMRCCPLAAAPTTIVEACHFYPRTPIPSWWTDGRTHTDCRLVQRQNDPFIHSNLRPQPFTKQETICLDWPEPKKTSTQTLQSIRYSITYASANMWLLLSNHTRDSQETINACLPAVHPASHPSDPHLCMLRVHEEDFSNRSYHWSRHYNRSVVGAAAAFTPTTVISSLPMQFWGLPQQFLVHPPRVQELLKMLLLLWIHRMSKYWSIDLLVRIIKKCTAEWIRGNGGKWIIRINNSNRTHPVTG